MVRETNTWSPRGIDAIMTQWAYTHPDAKAVTPICSEKKYKSSAAPTFPSTSRGTKNCAKAVQSTQATSINTSQSGTCRPLLAIPDT